MSAAPQFSVIIPTYNRSGTIIRAVESVLRQTCADFEIIVVDDGSTDDTRSKLLSLKDPRLVTLVISNSGGPARPRNAGARMANLDLNWLAARPFDLGPDIRRDERILKVRPPSSADAAWA